MTDQGRDEITVPVPRQTGSTGSDDGGPASDEELQRLRTEVAELRSRLATTDVEPTSVVMAPPPRGPRAGRWRPFAATALIVVAALLAPLSIVASWAHDEVADTDRYVASVAPLASDPAVQDAVIARITTEIFNRVDVQGVTQEALQALGAQGLPPRVTEGLSALQTPLANGVRSFVNEQVAKIIRSQAFADAWVAANREAHTQLVAVLTGEGTDTVAVSGNTVSINLAAVIRTVKAQLEQSGFALASKIPEVNAQFTVFQSADLSKAQNAFGVLERLARVLPVLALLLLAAGLFVARSRRRALLGAGLGVAAAMLLLGGTLNAFRPIYLDAVPADALPHDAAAVIYDTLVQFIRLNLRAVLVVALAVAAGAWLAGPSAAALGARRGLSGATAFVRGGGERHGVTTGPVGVFAYTYRTALRAAVIGVALLVYLLADHPTGGWTLAVLGITLVVLLVLELVGRPPSTDDATDELTPAASPGLV